MRRLKTIYHSWKKSSSTPINDLLVLAFLSLYLVLLANNSVWNKLWAIYSNNQIWFLFALFGLFAGVVFGALLLFSWRWVLKPWLVLLLLVTAVSAYAMDVLGYVIGANVYRSIFESHGQEIGALLTWRLAWYVLFLAVIPLAIIMRLRVVYSNWRLKGLVLVLVLVAVGVNIFCFRKQYVSLLRNHKQVRYFINPIRPLYAFGKYVSLAVRNVELGGFQVIDAAPVKLVSDDKPRLIILVVGESDRAINHQLNGYGRETNPLLSLRDDIYSFSNVFSCGTETTISVPCMFGPYTRHDFKVREAKHTENVLDLLSKSGVDVLWRDNDAGCKDVCARVAVDDFNDARIAPHCDETGCQDEVLLHKLQERIDHSPHGDKLIVLHKRGNHGPAYYKRYPERFAKFFPVCESNELYECSDEHIVNAYDNIVVYTDYFLHETIKLLENNQKYQTAMLYISDHGESLGENGIYLHAMPFMLAPQQQKHVPLIFWASRDFKIDHELLRQRINQALSHDNLFHSLLGLFAVNSVVYQAELDIFHN